MPSNQEESPSGTGNSGGRWTACLWLVPLALAGVIGYVLVHALNGAPRAGQSEPLRAADVPVSGGFPRAITDDGGAKIVIPRKPVRIVAGDAGSADVLSDLIAPERFAAVPFTVESYCGAREYFAAHPAIARYIKFNAETLLSFKPDLVFAASYHDSGAVQIVRDAGVPAVRFEQFRTFAGIRGYIQSVGLAVGEEQKAGEIVREFDQRLERIEKAVAGRPRPRVLAYSNYSGHGTVVGGGESQSEVLRRAGALNIAEELNLKGHPNFSFEQIIKANPDWLIVTGDDGLNSAQALILLGDPVLRSLPAVAQRRIAVIPDRYFTSISQHIVDAVEILARQIHPGALGQP
jgi:iron complex transport system substrate-binding protein